MARILVADDDRESRTKAKRLLVDAGYEVVEADGPTEARARLASGRCDLAVLDFRLRDGIKGDRSGLDVAVNSDPRIPKIIMSNKADRDEIMDSVRIGEDGFAVAIAFIDKLDIVPGRPDLLDAVSRGLDARRIWMRQKRETISEQLTTEYRNVSRMAMLHSWVHLLVNLVFAGLMVTTALYVHAGFTPMLFAMIAIVAGEVTNLMLMRGKEEALALRAGRQHMELLQAKRFEQLLAACDSISNAAEAEKARVDLIRTTTASWFGGRELIAAAEQSE
jgi:CheY-like chemotaxis protein